MSTDFSIRPVGAPAPSPVVPPPSKAANEAVTTELPASQSVTAADASASASASANNNPPIVNEDLSRQAFFDRAAAAVVFQVVDNRTNLVVKQYPDDAVLRRRAYFHTLELSKASSPRARATDRTA
jgi:uncharacterized FlaG/YvyC family protein